MPVLRLVRIPAPQPFELYEAMERESSVKRYNWATLFLCDIKMGTWPSRMGESQKLGK
jgi:hypothetical protein